MKNICNEITIDEIKHFFSLSKKVELLAIKCIDELVRKDTSIKYSNNTNEDWSSDEDKDLNAYNLNRCGKYFRNNTNFWFLGITLGKCENKFCLAFNDKKESNDFKTFENDNWSYKIVPDNIINNSSEQKQLNSLLEFIEKNIGK